ncbi:CRISPR-associated protein Cas4 [Methanolacinia paynteri]|uniref:CRISPR-associated protein Cas4 n=1 Tax=Methanolacinia paynteri TaxID=230356 RepID=UPI00064E1B98|nr:CRISPR-associated protein Cas4 [Methanolacinia paynteri]
MESPGAMINISDVLEYEFCPRFIYFMYCLNIRQHEELRFKVLAGREVHERISRTNRNYIRKKIGAEAKFTDVFLSSPEVHIKGILDEVLYLDDGTAAPLEYKFAQYKERMFKTTKSQLFLQAILIEENYDRVVEKGFVCFTRSNYKLVDIEIREKDKENAREEILNVLEIIGKGYYPKTRKNPNKCADCCYRNICV